MDQPLHVEDRADGVRVVTLTRPPANALDDTMLLALEAMADEAAASDAVRAVVLRADGRFFCGGFDLRAPRRTGDAVTAMVERYRDSHLKLLALGKPTIAVVQGHAIAGGLVLALACDHVVASRGEHRVGLNETAIGAAFPPVAFEIVRLRLTTPVLSELLLGAELHPVDALVRFGVVSELVEPTALDGRATALASRLAAHPREVYAHAKRSIVAPAIANIRSTTLAEELAVAALWSTDESRAARAAQRARLS
jgi:enoyl-CoA hydratase